MTAVPKTAAGRVLPPLDDLPFEAAATAVFGRFQGALASLLRAANGPTGKCTDVEETFGIDARLAWQIFRIATTSNPLAVGLTVPVRASMQRVFKAATKRGMDARAIAQVADAYEGYEQFVLMHAQDRDELEALLRPFLPQEQEKRELATRQAAFKAMSQLKGAAMEAEISAYVLFPSADGESVDRVLLVAELGLRRLRAGARIGFATMMLNGEQGVTRTIDGHPSQGPWSALLPEFCTNPLPKFEVKQTSNSTSYWVAGNDVGLRTSVDLVSAEHRPRALRRWSADGVIRKTGIFTAPNTPTKRTTMDLFIHQDVYPGQTPQLYAYDIIPYGVVKSTNDPERERDRLPINESIRMLGRGVFGADLPHAPAYMSMLQHVFGRLNRDPGEFRSFRLDIQYPLSGAQYLMALDVPVKDRER